VRPADHSIFPSAQSRLPHPSAERPFFQSKQTFGGFITTRTKSYRIRRVFEVLWKHVNLVAETRSRKTEIFIQKSFRRVWEVWVRGGPERATFTDSDTTHQFLIDFQGNCLYFTVPHMHGRQMFKKLSVYTLTPMEFEKFNSRIEPCIWGMIFWRNNFAVFGTKSQKIVKNTSFSL